MKQLNVGKPKKFRKYVPMVDASPNSYGYKREGAFLKYLQDKGTKRHAFQMPSRPSATTASDIATMDAKTKANMTIEQRKALDNQTKKLAGATEEGTVSIVNSNSQLISTHSNQVNSTGGGGVGGLIPSHTASSGNNSVEKVTFVQVDR